MSEGVSEGAATGAVAGLEASLVTFPNTGTSMSMAISLQSYLPS